MRYVLALILSFIPATAFANVYVAPQVGAVGPSTVMQAGAGSMAQVSFGPFPDGARVKVKFDASSSSYTDFKILTCPITEATKYISKQAARCRPYNFNTAGEVTLDAEPNVQMTVILDNTNALLTSKKVSVSSYFLINASDEIQTSMKKGLGQTLDYMRHYISSEPFNISIAPCGAVNAFSVTDGGDITLCTELIVDSSEKGLKHSVLGIFAHELGHTYQNLWGSPHYANEKSADEFAVALLFITENFPPLEGMDINEEDSGTPEEVVNDMIGFFESISNIGAEAQAAMLGDQHPLSAQRINSLRQILSAPQYFVERWVTEIYPHLTVPALESVIANPHIGADVELAKKLLAEKQNRSALSVSSSVISPAMPAVVPTFNQITVSPQILKKLKAYAVLNDLNDANSAAETILENHFKKP